MNLTNAREGMEYIIRDIVTDDETAQEIADQLLKDPNLGFMGATMLVEEGLLNGFGTWWVPYLYIWTVLWGAVMLLPKKLEGKKASIVYAVVCSLHGFLYGVLYAPFQAFVHHLNLEGTLTWIATGLAFDITHGISNFVCTLILCVPFIKLLKTAEKLTR